MLQPNELNNLLDEYRNSLFKSGEDTSIREGLLRLNEDPSVKLFKRLVDCISDLEKRLQEVESKSGDA